MVPKILLQSEHLHLPHPRTYRIEFHLDHQIVYHFVLLIILVSMHFAPSMSLLDNSDMSYSNYSKNRIHIIESTIDENIFRKDANFSTYGQFSDDKPNYIISRVKRQERRFTRWDPLGFFKKKTKTKNKFDIPKIEVPKIKVTPKLPEIRLISKGKNNFHYHHPELKGQSAVMLPDYKLLHSHHPGLLTDRIIQKQKSYSSHAQKGDTEILRHQFNLVNDNSDSDLTRPRFPSSNDHTWQPDPIYESPTSRSLIMEEDVNQLRFQNSDKTGIQKVNFQSFYNPSAVVSSQSKVNKNYQLDESRNFNPHYFFNEGKYLSNLNYNREFSQGRESRELSPVSFYPKNRYRMVDIKKEQEKSQLTKTRDIPFVNDNMFGTPVENVKEINSGKQFKEIKSPYDKGWQKAKNANLGIRIERERIAKSNKRKDKGKNVHSKRPSGYRPSGRRGGSNYRNRHRYRPSGSYRSRTQKFRKKPSSSRRFHSSAKVKSGKNYKKKNKSKWSKIWGSKREEEIPNISIKGVTSVLFALKGSNVEFLCTGEEASETISATWSRIHGELLNDTRFSVTKSGIMQITNVHSSDSEIYVCKEAETGKEYKHVLEVYLPPKPGYEINWQYECEMCQQKNLPDIKSIVHAKLKENVCSSGKCEITDVRVACLRSKLTSESVLDITVYISGVFQNNLQCDTMECMKIKLQDHVKKAVERLKRYVTLGMRLDNDDFNFVWGSLKQKKREICPAGHGRQQDRCAPCEPGLYSETGEGCVQCESGYYQPNLGGKTCFRCPRQRYLDKPLPLECTVGHENEFRMNKISFIMPLTVAIVFFIVLLFCCFRCLTNLRDGETTPEEES